MSRVSPPQRLCLTPRWYCPNDHPYVDWRLVGARHSGACIEERSIGISDRNGVPIHENDILRFDICGITHGPERDEGIIGEVWYCVEDACWAIGCWSESTYTYHYTFSDRIDRKTLEVIGNVHQNADLLT